MKHHRFSVTLKLAGPILIRGNAPMAWGLDAAVTRDANGTPILPRTLVHGRLREALTELVDIAGDAFRPALSHAEIGDLFGESTDATGPDDPDQARQRNQPLRRRLNVSDFEGPRGATARASVRHRVALDSRTGAARAHHLLVAEAPFGAGEEVPFRGTITCRSSGAGGEKERLQNLLEVGLKWITQLGGSRTVGFGELLSADVTSMEAEEPVQTAVPPCPSGTISRRLQLVLRPLAPFCIARPRLTQNYYESEEVIPGAALKGCVAEAWRQAAGVPPRAIAEGITQYVLGNKGPRQELAKWFDRLVFSHAFPATRMEPPGAPRPVMPPLSLAKSPGTSAASHCFDLAAQPIPCLVGGEAPEFRFDWKEVERRLVDGPVFGWAIPTRSVRVRNKMDPGRRTAQDQALFALETVHPDGVEWRSWIDLSAVPETELPLVLEQLRGLLAQPLDGLGKTKAAFRVHETDATARMESRLEPRDGLWVVTLQTPALLADPRNLSTVGSVELAHDAYDSVWKQLSNGALRLKRHFARQHLAGGEYLWRRFQHGREYRPWLLTGAGSVFVLEPSSPDVHESAERSVRKWASTGLPLPDWTQEWHGLSGKPGTDWTRCPFVPENGFGEIAVNIDLPVPTTPIEPLAYV